MNQTSLPPPISGLLELKGRTNNMREYPEITLVVRKKKLNQKER